MTIGSDTGLDVTPDADARRLALEAIASLVYVKKPRPTNCSGARSYPKTSSGVS